MNKQPNTKRIIVAVVLIYVVFAVLLNSVGTVILQVIGNYGVAKSEAAILEAFKDLPIAIVSFLVASFLPRIGYKNAMLAALALVCVACLSMPLLPSFLTTKLLFLCVGVAFALTKVSVYSTVGLVAKDARHHAGLMNTLEGCFMVGVLSAYFVFGHFIDSNDPRSQSWLNVYWLLALLCAGVFVLLLSTRFPPMPVTPSSGSRLGDFTAMIKLTAKPLVAVFILSAFLYVLVEQSIGTWLPTFNNEILKLPTAMSVQVTSVFAASLAIGRLGAGVIMRRLHWYPVLCACVLGMAATVLVALPMTRGIAHDPHVTWLTAPLATFVFPLIGLFMAPIYPGINSVMLSSLPPAQHSSMTGLLVIFSALGGTTGSYVTGYVFGHVDGHSAFYLTLLPIGLLLVTIWLFRRQVEGQGPVGSTRAVA